MNDTVLVSHDARGIATITLNRAEKRNAFDDALIRRLHSAIDDVANDVAVRAVVLTGAGSVFSAGADLDHMRRQGNMSERENYEDALRFAECLQALNELPKPVIAKINGSAYGGGVGLIACVDIAIAVNTAKFALTEVRFGIVPAVISPYVVAAISARQARRWFLTAATLTAQECRDIHLLHDVVAAAELETAVEKNLVLLLQGGPCAHREAKQLVRDVNSVHDQSQLSTTMLPSHTAKLLARLRRSTEGKEGLTAFLEGHKPTWSIAASDSSK